MRKTTITLLLLWPLCLILLLSNLSAALAQEIPAGKIVNLRGNVKVIPANVKTAKPAKVGLELQKGDTIKTGADGWVAVLLADETLLQLNRFSNFVLKEVAPVSGWTRQRRIIQTGTAATRSFLNLERGQAWFRNKNRAARIQIDTLSVVVGVRGTEIDLKVADDDTAVLTVLEGQVAAANDFGALDVGPGEQVIARPGQPLLKTLLLTPEDAVQWTIPVPPLFEERDVTPEIRQALDHLHAGEVKPARDALLKLTGKSPNQSPAWSLLALTELMLGRNQEANEASTRAVATAPRSSNALLIQSYTLQAAFDLEAALAATRKALLLDGNNVPALVNLARLRFGMDDLEEATAAIEKARRLAPDHGEVLNLLGFIHLANRQIDQAVDAFQQAVMRDPSLGEPRMGLAIAEMRRGNTANALEEISAAVLLDPRRSLYLSYWAKMLYQVERFDRALDVLATASQLDPRDPTPELYRAIILRDRNRPSEAIAAVNRAIKLNDNRAVYRSRFLLDRDLAVKNVDLSILYNQLGLAAWAQSKAQNSIDRDYTNASGHLFLAGALHEFENRSWPAASEYLLARLMEPANLNTFNTFNEYTSFFERPSISGALSGIIGNRDTKGGDVIAFGAIPAANLAFGADLYYKETDGWRETNGERTGNGAVMFKWDATPKDGFMGVASHQKTKQKDLFDRRYEYDSPSDPEDWTESRLTRFELGYHRHISPRSDLLLYWNRMEDKGELFDRGIFGPLDLLADYRRPFDQLQGQILFKAGSHQLLAGTTQYRGDYDFNSHISILNIDSYNASEQRLESYHLSDIWNPIPRLTIEGAVYFDHMRNSDPVNDTRWSLSEWNPRLGLTFRLTPADTLRVAAFRYLLPFISSRMDPSSVSGIPVYRNAFEGSLVKEWDIAWEHEWQNAFLSANLFHLEKKYPHVIMSGADPVMITDRGRTKGVEIFLNRLFAYGFGLSAAYRYLQIGDEGQSDADREDHEAKATLKHVNRLGISAFVSETFRHARFKSTSRADEDIWITDGGLGYELPRKLCSLNLEIRNLFDQRFNWITDNFSVRGRAPARETIFTVSFNF